MHSPAQIFATKIVQRLQSSGYTAYFAGGCVRDQLMNRTPKDFDVATSATPNQVLALFPRGQQVGAAFGVILLVEKNGDLRIQVEVATFRSDGTYSDGRHPDSVHFTTADQDAKRRDFTCNGLFFDPLANQGNGQLLDFVGGRNDIQNKFLRAIGSAEARFTEDHLRMLRAVRFAARLNFTIEPDTHAAIHRHAANIKSISRERIGEELRLILEHPTRVAAVTLLRDLNLLQEIWPAAVSQAHFTPPLISALPNPITRPLALAALALDLALNPIAATTADQLQQSFALANPERDEIAWLLEKRSILLNPSRWSRSALKRLLADPRWPALESLHAAQSPPPPADPASLKKWTQQLRIEGVAPEPFITGDTLISMGAAPGPNFKQWLQSLYDRQLEGELTTQEQARAAAAQLIAKG